MKKLIIVSSVFCIVVIASCNSASNSLKAVSNRVDTLYSCIPCGYECDTAVLTTPGTCTNCKMQLVEKQTIVHKNIAIDSLCNLANSNTIFLDVRTLEEFTGKAPDKFGAIKNAINIPIQQLEQRIKELDAYKEKQLIVYCSHSHRSPMASYMLTQSGFKNVINMNGGMSVWKDKMKDPICNFKLFLKQ